MDDRDRDQRFTTLQEGIAAHARINPDGIAISAPGRSALSYGRLHDLIESRLTWLNGMGIGRGDRIAMVLPNGPEMATAFLSIAAGASAAPLNPAYQAAEFEFYLTDLKVKALIIQAGMESSAREVAAGLGIPLIELVPQHEQAAGSFSFSGEVTVQAVPAYSTADEEALVLHTSGTTSRPKIVPLSQRNLCASAHNIATTLELAQEDLCLNVMPLFHIHGLMAAVTASLTAGGGVICAPGFEASSFFEWLKQCRPTWFTAVPTILMAILETADNHREVIARTSLRFIRSSSSSLPPRIMSRLEQTFNVPVIEAYGMTEAAHQIASNPLPPAERKPGSVGITGGPQVAIMDMAGTMLARGETGEIVIRGANVTSGYENNPTANSQAYTRGWFRTGDQGWMDEDGYLHITGRLKEIINRGGEKVSPREVDEALLEHPEVLQAATFAVPHASLGEDIAAAVVVKDKTTLDGKALRRSLFGRLAEYKIPNRIIVVAEIPKGPTGKIQRIVLAERLAHELQDVYTAPRTAMESSLAAIFEDALGRNTPIGIYDNFFSAGGDSLSGARVIAQIHERFRCELPVTALFRFPTIAELVGEIRENSAPPLLISPRKTDGTAPPLSLAQQRLWLIEQLEPERSINNVVRMLHIRGNLNQTALKLALNNIITRHDILRTTFPSDGEEPVQHIAPAYSIKLAIENITTHPPAQQKNELRRYADGEACHSFDLTLLPLIRATLIIVDDQEYVLIITLHHIIADGWSMGIFSRELEAFYHSALQNQSPQLPALSIQYADFAEWQQEWLKSQAAEPLEAYWKKQLSGAPRLEPPADRPYANAPDYRAARCALTLSPQLSLDLKRLGQEENCTLFMVLLACFNLLLHRYTNETDIVIGTPVSGRHGLEPIKDLIGFFVNTVALRTDLSGNPGFRQLLARVRNTAVEAYKHSRLPFDKVVEILSPDRREYRNPLFEVMINIHESAWHEFNLDGLNIQEWQLAEPLTDVALSLDILQRDEQLHLSLRYQTALFDAWRINNMLMNLHTLLKESTSNPDQTISKLPLLSEQERHTLLVEWNRTQRDYPQDKSIPEVFEQQVRATPDGVAVVYENRKISYSELNTRANQLAHHLLARGVKPEQPVGLLMDRSGELIICILAVLKAGGAYVPLDPGSPRERLAIMIKDAQIEFLITDSIHLGSLPEFGSHPIIIDDDRPLIVNEDDSTPISNTMGTSVAYIIFTSGSTGRPKGVCIPHRAVIRLVLNTNYIDLNNNDVVGQVANIAFDAATFEIWGALLNGGRLHILPTEALLSQQNLNALLHKHGVTTLLLTTALFNLLVEREPSAFSHLKHLLFGGEACDPRRVQKCLIYGPPQRLLHAYGPTETTTFATWHEVTKVADDAHTVPIGRPISNTTTYILDENLQLTPIGIIGELHIGGQGVARGYLQRPELTAEKFIADPFSGQPGSVLYRTGDLVRYQQNGNIEYVGRRDFQVKLRGFRIELGEIESVLRQHPLVSDCIVIVREDSPGDKRLVAYVTPNTETRPTGHELRRHAQFHLPDYMIPTAFVIIATLPLTSNGKIDRNALPAPTSDRTTGAKYLAARSEIEAHLATLWQEVLGLDTIGVHDDFLELGGHSLLATRILAKVRDDFSIDISLGSFYTHPTIAHLAQELETGGKTAAHKQYPPLVPVPRGDHIPVSYPQESIIFLDQLTPDILAYNSQACIYFKGKIKIPLLEKALDHLITRHESLRTTFHIRNGVPTQQIQEPWHMKIPLIDLSDTPQDGRARRTAEIIDREVRHHFDIEKLPLLRWTLLRLGDDDFIVIHVEHHLPHDGWSFAVFMNEFKQTYTDLYHGRTPQLPLMPIQFADYTLWQRKYLQGTALSSLLDYWKKSLEGASSELHLPTDFPRPAKQSFRGTEVVQELVPRLANSLRSFCRREGVTLYMAMLAAFYILISRYTRQSDLTIGTGVANRNLKETECLIGMIVNTLALRLDIPPDIHFRMLLQKIKELTLSAYNYQDLPFEKLVEELKLDRDLSRNPLFQTMFSFHDSSVPLLNLPEASGGFHYPHNGSSKFDLSVIVIPWAEQRIGLSDKEQNDVITIRWEYSTDLFKHETIQRITEHYRHILKQQISAPDRLVADFELTTEEERRILQIEWNQTSATYDHDLCVQTVFERQASLTPDAMALSYRDENLNYSELNRRANRLAHYLIAQGVKPGIRVAMLMERGIEAVISLLAIIKAGGTYVPLDPANPDSRLHFLVNDSQAGFIVGHGSVLPQMDACISIALDQEAAKIDACDDTDPITADNPERPLYIMYTSGSTGTPKGAEIPHRAVNRLVQNSGVAHFGAGRVFMLLAPLSFDASTFEIWGPLLNGGRCVIYPERLPEFDVLARVIRANGVTTLWLTASLFNKIIDEAPQTLVGVEQLLSGGEALSVDHIRRAQQALPDIEFINGYGPTENTTFTCCYRIPRPVEERMSSIPIGRPIGNTTVYVLDCNMHCAPIGVPGELYVGGAGLALGYLNQPKLTAERFISSPFTPGEKLYKTGDLVRYLPDGNLEYLGRLDQQLKLHGFRIEPGEVEYILRRHNLVDDCAVILREDTPDDKRLIAYLAGRSEVTEETLRAYLKTRLPAFMVPSAFIVLEQLPLNANGKIDRQALPPPGVASRNQAFAAPTNVLENEITAIWREALGIEQLGIHDNFFTMGGHSLLAAQTIARINNALGMQVPLALLFEYPTVAAFAREVDQLQLNLMINADNLEAMLKELEQHDDGDTTN